MKICFAVSAGGHLEEINQLKTIINKYDCFFVIPSIGNYYKSEKRIYLTVDPTAKNKVFSFLKYFVLFFQQAFIFIKETPDVIISNGAGYAVPACLLAKLFRKKIIFFETFSRIYVPSKSGRFVYRFADLFLVQHKPLLKELPKAIMGGWIY